MGDDLPLRLLRATAAKGDRGLRHVGCTEAFREGAILLTDLREA
jgi:hypothetical protein